MLKMSSISGLPRPQAREKTLGTRLVPLGSVRSPDWGVHVLYRPPPSSVGVSLLIRLFCRLVAVAHLSLHNRRTFAINLADLVYMNPILRLRRSPRIGQVGGVPFSLPVCFCGWFYFLFFLSCSFQASPETFDLPFKVDNWKGLERGCYRLTVTQLKSLNETVSNNIKGKWTLKIKKNEQSKSRPFSFRWNWN